jgi:tetratricopeptide (TPR) repeat protein
MRMKRVVAVIAIGLFAAACASRTDLRRPATQDDFGVQMAKMNLWREAMFRFKRAVQIDPSDARAHNNLAVAYEAVGDFENARKEYLEALKLDRTNAYIQKNYSRYVEFLSRNRKREASTKTAGPAMPKAGGSATVQTSTPDYPPPPGGGTAKPGQGPTPPSDLPPPAPPKPPVATPQPMPPTPPPGGSR